MQPYSPARQPVVVQRTRDYGEKREVLRFNRQCEELERSWNRIHTLHSQVNTASDEIESDFEDVAQQEIRNLHRRMLKVSEKQKLPTLTLFPSKKKLESVKY